MADTLRRLGNLTLEIAWATLILLLPITSFPLLSRLTGGTMVAPASIIPLGWLVIFWFVFYLFKKGVLPRESIPFLLFICAALLSTAKAFFINTPPAKAQGILGEEISAGLTLAIGAAFYLVAAGWLSRSETKLRWTLKLVDASGAILLAWSLVQAIFIFFFHGKYPGILERFQEFFSTRSLFLTRTTGFAFEPSWLAHMLNLTFLPYWLAATLTGWSAFRGRIWKVSLENILLVLGLGILLISSRVGTLAILLVAAFLGIYYTVRLGKWLQDWVSSHLGQVPTALQKTVQTLLPGLILIGFLSVFLLGAIGLVFVLSHVDKRLAVFFNIRSMTQLKQISVNIYTILNYLQFAERYVYWVAGWSVFNLHPFLGVGLGNAGFYFQNTLPSFSWSLPEVMDSLYRTGSILNIKSMWVRLLAETGIVGFSAFIAWFTVLAKSSWALKQSKTPLFKMIGWTGLFVLIAYVVEGFSIDTFALPYLWVSMGIVCAAATLVRKGSES